VSANRESYLALNKDVKTYAAVRRNAWGTRPYEISALTVSDSCTHNQCPFRKIADD
jgi:hypothetical protein